MSISGAGKMGSSSDKLIVCLKAVVRLDASHDDEKLITKLQQIGGDWSIEVDRGREEFNIEVTKETRVGDTTAGINLYKAMNNEFHVCSYKLSYQKKQKQDAMLLNTNNHHEEQSTLSPKAAIEEIKESLRILMSQSNSVHKNQTIHMNKASSSSSVTQDTATRGSDQAVSVTEVCGPKNRSARTKRPPVHLQDYV